MNLEIEGIAETHLKDIDVVDLDKYKWLGHNRSNNHVNAWAGSGVFFFKIKYNLLEEFNFSISRLGFLIVVICQCSIKSTCNASFL